MERTWAAIFFKYFYFISRYALVSSFLSHILRVYCKNQEAGRRGPDGGKKKTKEIERTYM